MTDDLIRRSDAIEAECNHCGWRSQCEEDSGYWCESGGLIRRDIPSVDAVPIADYRSMENTCYKLQKALYERAEQTEPQKIIGESFPSYITEDRATQVLDGWQANPRTSTTAVEDEPQTDCAWK